MTTQNSVLEPFLNEDAAKHQTSDAGVSTDSRVSPGKQTRFQSFRSGIGGYGHRVLNSAERLIIALRDSIVNVGTALAGSIVLLPFTIVARGLYVLLRTLLTSGKDLVLSIARLIFEVLRLPFHGLARLFRAFNQHFLFPMLKRVREDDTFAVVALVLLCVSVAAIYAVVRMIFH